MSSNYRFGVHVQVHVLPKAASQEIVDGYGLVRSSSMTGSAQARFVPCISVTCA